MPEMAELSVSRPILPGSTIGMLGGGQLGRMSLLAGRKMGYRFVVLDPAGDRAPAAAVADEVIAASFDDPEALRALAAKVDVVTVEFENVSAFALDLLAESVPVRPGSKVLATCQNRQAEKTFLRSHRIPCAPFAVVESAEALRDALAEMGTPAVLKTADFGYDGKGQIKLTGGEDPVAVWQALDSPAGVLEKWITFEGEFSVICARSANGEEAVFPLAENLHRNHILHTTLAPARLPAEAAREAEALALQVARELDVVGLIAVELFRTSEGWLVNEMAPRPHNSGHHTFDAGRTSQFEQHIRAVCGLPLGDPSLFSPVVMVNLLGDVWRDGEAPDWTTVWKCPSAKLHLYGKEIAKPGRKMGHFTVSGKDLEAAWEQARVIEKSLFGS
jgi:5-(carboxyamino)imidazole ribonucleotide synthase